jgi:hypothetical protein
MPNEVMRQAQAKLRAPKYGTMDRAAIWEEAVKVLTEHFTQAGYDVHRNGTRLHVIDREPGNPLDRGGSRLTTIEHQSARYDGAVTP